MSSTIADLVNAADVFTPHPPVEVSPQWPEPPGDAAFTGFVGDVVSAVDPHTEADRVAVAAQLLGAFMVGVGSGPRFMVGATSHALRENFLIVGRTSKARKGDSFEPVRAILRVADEEFARARIVNGLSTGEGLIHAVRDPVMKTSPIREDGVITGYQDEIIDQGVSDKRLFVVEPEFARLLRVAGREGNTVSAVVRQAWDAGATPLRVMTRSNAEQATGAHVGLVGHITIEELRRELSPTESANGFFNRFILAVVKRSKLLPEPEPFSGRKVEELGLRLSRLMEAARRAGVMTRDAEASLLWRNIYPSLSEERPGLVATLTARGEAHVLRLSMAYALLDGTSTIRAEHIAAAAELWAYSERSVAYLFGGLSGNPEADRILARLADGPLDRTQITRDVFKGHIRGSDLTVALEYLMSSGKAKRTKETTGGRDREVWGAV